MVVVDRLSKYVHFSALGPNFTAVSVANQFVKDIVRLHGFPTNIVSDRDPIFQSQFWRELFRLQQTTLSMSSSYHPQSDGQTEVINRCLEDYLRCFISDWPRQWLLLLPWAELCYNTSQHSASRSTPFEAVYGRPPPTLTDYIMSSSSSLAVDQSLTTRSDALSSLRECLRRAQQRMKRQADATRSDREYSAGNWVFVKLRPYRQTSALNHPSHKLAMRYYGPFQVLARIGPVAYRLDLPASSKIHNVFHASFLKLCLGDPLTSPISLPPPYDQHSSLPSPKKLIGFRKILQHGNSITQFLIEWATLPAAEATWMDTTTFLQDYPNFDLEDKVLFDAGGNVAALIEQEQQARGNAAASVEQEEQRIAEPRDKEATSEQSCGTHVPASEAGRTIAAPANRRSKRNTSAPARMSDYVSLASIK